MSELDKPNFEFKVPDDVDLSEPSRNCNLHGDYWGDECDSCKTERALKERARLVKQYRYQELGLPERYFGLRLESFIATTAKQKAAVDQVRLLLEGGMLFMLMTGTVGTGKTHLASAALNHWADRDKGHGLYTTAARMLRTIKETWNTRDSEQEAINEFVNPTLLVIDEIGATFGSDTERMYLSEIISDRYNYERPTILISNLSVKALEGANGEKPVFDERARDRMKQGGKLVVCEWDSFRGNK